MELQRVFRTEVWPGLHGQNVQALTHRMARPRGGNIGKGLPLFGQPVDQAIWDPAAKELDLPLYRLLGGTSTASAPTRAASITTSPPRRRPPSSRRRRGRGSPPSRSRSATPISPGPRAPQSNCGGGRAGRDADGGCERGWSPKEAIRRAHAYRDAGFTIYWIEDPCLRDDFAGLAQVGQEVPFAHINSGEYLDTRGKRLLMEHRAVDILNVHGSITADAARRPGWPMSTVSRSRSAIRSLELGVHLAAALPEAKWIEYSFQDYNQMVEQPIQFEGGYAIAPDRPGHGLTIADAARTEYARADAE